MELLRNAESTDDLSTLEFLDKNILCNILQTRFEKKKYYTYIGDVLVAVNPCQKLTIYDEEHHERYSSLLERKNQAPHIFWVADAAYRAMVRSDSKQCIVVSGDSGAGKTESTKYILKHLARQEQCSRLDLVQNIDQVNPLMELFGNASTLLNKNSSRFGKLTELLYDNGGRLQGGEIQCFILEKSRVVEHRPGERNFHIFYSMLSGMESTELQSMGLHEGFDYRILQSHSPLTSSNKRVSFREPSTRKEFAANFQKAKGALHGIGFSSDEESQIYRVLAAILHITGIEFDEDEESDGVIIVDEEPLTEACNQLGLTDIKAMAEALVATTSFISGHEVKITHKSVARANDGRDAVAKKLYSCLFSGIVDRINQKLHDESQAGEALSIGILDISGFEDFTENRFEQLLINMANEKLHHYFQEYIFELEKQDLEAEGIGGGTIHFQDNSDVLELFFGKIVKLLEDETKVPGSNSNTLVKSLNKECEGHQRYRCENGCNFGIAHYARKVTYCAEGFLDKNTETLSRSLTDCLQKSGITFVQSYVDRENQIAGPHTPRLVCIISVVDTITVRSHRTDSVNFDNIYILQNIHSAEIFLFKWLDEKTSISVLQPLFKSLEQLTAKLNDANPLFVRCIKPNTNLQQGKFDTRLTRSQLESSGLLEVADIRHRGFAVRLEFETFINRYQTLVDQLLGKGEANAIAGVPSDFKSLTKRLLDVVDIKGYEMGFTKIFLKYRHMEKLDEKIESLKREKEMKEQRRIAAEKRLKEKAKAKMKYTPLNAKGDINEKTMYKVIDDNNNMAEPDDKKFLHEKEKMFVNIPIEVDENKTEKNTKRLAFDMFRLSEREVEESSKCEDVSLRIIRGVMYIVLFLVVMVTAMISTTTLLFMSSNLFQDRAQTPRVSNQILICITTPLVLTWFVNVFKFLFGTKESPEVGLWFGVVVLESIEMFGVALLCFSVVPSMNLVHGVVISSASGQIPSLLNLFGHIQVKRKNKFAMRVLTTLFAIIALIVQYGIHPVIHMTEVFSVTSPEESLFRGKWTLSVSLVCMSIGYWENFVHNDIAIGPLKLSVARWRSKVHRCRETLTVLTEPVKVGLLVALTHIMVVDHEFTLQTLQNIPFYETTSTTESPTVSNSNVTDLGNVSTSNYTTTENHSVSNEDSVNLNWIYEEYGYILLQISTSLVCSYAALLACKLQMQRFSFSLALILVAPVTISLLLLQCHYDIKGYIWFTDELECSNMTLDKQMWVLVAGGCLWVSIILLTYGIWIPRCERMAKAERLFVMPIRGAVSVGLNLLLRRRNDILYEAIDTTRRRKSDDRLPLTPDEKEIRPMLYVCATLWHEVKQEMVQLLKSLFRLDLHQCSSRITEKKCKTKDPDYFDLSIQIMFDDAFQTDEDTKQRVVNSWVRQFVECVEEAAMSVARHVEWENHPTKIETPYGGQLVWNMPGGTTMTVHLKDKNRIRHRKRWSQIMYMYYLLGYKPFGTKCEDSIVDEYVDGKKKNRRRFRPFASLLNKLDLRTFEKSENTYILALDGDVDFRPDAVQLLLDRMKKNKKVGAVCGRIHPIGSGPLIWYQQFEYAVGHWLQKATEHVIGCVLCCPGCFSVFRASALMDDNVVRMYTTKPTEARHYIQYDQGEDRWLCTLLLQQGYKIDYCAGADALTYAPETFRDFYVQRRRWAPSTLANIMDLLSSWRTTVKMNDNISTLFIIYQFILLSSSLLSPGAITLMIAGSFNAVLKTNMWQSYLITITPIALYVAVCLKMKHDTQILVAGLLSTVFTIVMVIVTVGTIMNIVDDHFYAPNVMFLEGLAVIFIIAGVWHPKEILCLPNGIIYFLTVPSTFVFLTIYYFCNLNNVTWGTREGPKKVDQTAVVKKNNESSERNGILNALGVYSLIHEIFAFIRQTMGSLKEGNKEAKQTEIQEVVVIPDEVERESCRGKMNRQETVIDDPSFWTLDTCLGGGRVGNITIDETEFWQIFIGKYLYPIVPNKEEEEKIKENLACIRNNVVFAICLLNLLFSVAILQLQINKKDLKSFFIIGKYEPISIAFMAAFGLILLLQFFSMLIHRWGTFLHLIASKHIGLFNSETDSISATQEAQREIKNITTSDLLPDYDSETDEEELTTTKMLKRQISVEPDYSSNDEDTTEDSNRSMTAYEKQFKTTYRTLHHRYKQRQKIMPDDRFREWTRKHGHTRSIHNIMSSGHTRHRHRRRAKAVHHV
ncbi:hypothetical protein ScPMuIL_018532 [Solemya velum]